MIQLLRGKPTVQPLFKQTSTTRQTLALSTPAADTFQRSANVRFGVQDKRPQPDSSQYRDFEKGLRNPAITYTPPKWVNALTEKIKMASQYASKDWATNSVEGQRIQTWNRESLDTLFNAFPQEIGDTLRGLPPAQKEGLFELVLDLGKKPEAMIYDKNGEKEYVDRSYAG